MEQIKAIEAASLNIKDVYKTNAELMKNIHSDQDDILKELDGVESELD